MQQDSTIVVNTSSRTDSGVRKSPRTTTLEFVKQFARSCRILQGLDHDHYLIAN